MQDMVPSRHRSLMLPVIEAPMPVRPRDFFHYLAAHPDDAVWGVQVIAGGRTAIGARTPYPPPGHPNGHAFAWEAGRTLDEFQVVLIGTGSGTFRSRHGGERALTTGDVFLLFPGEWHSYRPDPGRGWDERWLAFTGDMPARLAQAGVIAPAQPVVAAGGDPDLVEAFDLALDRLRREPPGFRAELAAAVLTVLARLSAITASAQEPSPHRRRLRAIAMRIQDGCPEVLDVAALADEAGLSLAQFRRVFSAEIGMAPKVYHQHIRLVRARHLLADHRLRIKDVAEQLGFGNEFYFSRLFTRHMGVSPVRWRQRHGAG